MVLRILALEDRIVYNRAVAHATVAPAIGTDSGLATVSTGSVNLPPPPHILVVPKPISQEGSILQSAKIGIKVVV